MSKLPDVEALALFAKVAETGSFARTAEEYGLAKATVSKAIARLEARLGARLFHRTSRRLSLSETGRVLSGRAARLLHEAEAAEAEAAAQSAAPRGKVRLAAPMSFGLLHLAPILPEFMRLYPEVELHVDLDDRKLDLIAGGFDAALRIGVLDESRLIARRLCPIRMLVVAAPSYLARHPAPTRPAELKAHACLAYAYSPSGDLWRFAGPDGQEESVRVSGPLTANSGDALVEAVCEGLGLALLPDFIVYAKLQRGGLVTVLDDWSAPALSLNIVSPPGASGVRRPPKMQVLFDFLVSRFTAGHAPWLGGHAAPA